MTHIIIHGNEKTRERYLLKLVSLILKKDISESSLRNNPDIHILKPTGQSIGIEEVKGVQKEMVYMPFQEEFQISIIFDAHKLTEEAQNAFLKTLEEQPISTVYILLIDNEKNVLSTILSRGVRHYVKEKGEKEVQEVVKPKLISGDLVSRFKEAESIAEKKNDEIIKYITDVQMYYKQKMKEDILNGKSGKKIFKRIEEAQKVVDRIRGNGNKRLVLENFVIQTK